MNWRPIICLIAALAVAGCGRFYVGPQGDQLRTRPYLVWLHAAHPYPAATKVVLHVAWTDDMANGTYVERTLPDRILTPAERKRFDRMVIHAQIVGPAPAGMNEPMGPACFVPHHFFRYLDAQGRQLGEIAVCFCCGQSKATPPLPFEDGHHANWMFVQTFYARTFLESIGVPTKMNCK